MKEKRHNVKQLIKSRDKWKEKAKKYRKRMRSAEDMVRYYKRKSAKEQ
jgi:hypothetical protein